MKSKLNLLPDNPDETSLGRFPKWLHRKMPQGHLLWKTHEVLNSHRLPTVCEEANCPNLPECYSKKTATFLAMGKECTRNCGFCDIDFSKKPKPLEEDEPKRLSDSVKELGLKHVVITMVARDDLPDGGSLHLFRIIETVRRENPGVTIEVLTSDFEGKKESIDQVLAANPNIFNHNLETVQRLSPRVRHKATYERSLEFLKYVKSHTQGYVKSGIMVGLGETMQEVKQTLQDLKNINCDIVTIGHYLQPNNQKLTVKSFVTPEEFEDYAAYGRSLGIKHIYSGPFVRSSYNATAIYEAINERN